MAESNRPYSQRKTPMNVRRRAIDLAQTDLVTTGHLRPEATLPLVVQPNVDGVDLIEWVRNNLDMIESQLLRHGAILFRGFNIDSLIEFEKFALTICPELFHENGELPRDNVTGKVYTPVKYPASRPILWHNENTFCPRWPMKIWFFCLKPAEQGGETPIADSRKVFQLIDPAVREKFVKKNIMYVRNYGEGMGLSWQTVFQTEDKSEVEEYCRKNFIEFEWKGERFKTLSVRPAIAKHPKTGETVWFNQATHWHVSCLDPEVRESLSSLYREQDFPRNCYYGDGSAIEDSVMEEICNVYSKTEVCFPWQKRDILLLDNMLAAHARNPYSGTREIFVTMGEMMSLREIGPWGEAA